MKELLPLPDELVVEFLKYYNHLALLNIIMKIRICTLIAFLLFLVLQTRQTFAQTQKKSAVKTSAAQTDYLSLGKKQFQHKEFAKALSSLQTFLKKDSVNKDGLLYSALSAQGLANRKLAHSYFEKYFNLRGKQPMAYTNLAKLYLDEKDEEKAFSAIESGLIANPNDQDLLDTKTMLRVHFNRIDNNIADLEEGLRVQPDNKDLILRAGLLYENSGKSPLALPNYLKGLKTAPNDYDLNFMAGLYKFNEGVSIKRTADVMDINTYERSGKEIETKAFAKFKEALPFFEKAYAVRADETLRQNLAYLYRVLEMKDKLAKVSK